MLVSDVINFAVNGEIANLSVAKVGDSDPDRIANEAKLLSYINQGIIALYTKFGLAHQSRTLDNVVDGASYTMPADYINLIYAVDNQVEPMEIPINDEFAEYSIFEPAPFSIFVVKDDLKYELSSEIYITYQAVPPLLTATTDVVALGYQFLEPLLMYVSYKAHSPTDAASQQNQNNHFIKYLGACKEVRSMGLTTADNQSNYKHDSRGF